LIAVRRFIIVVGTSKGFETRLIGVGVSVVAEKTTLQATKGF
jgi:hypothetical protein